jgi:dolichyl-phosphate beta-glucosyltransferase
MCSKKFTKTTAASSFGKDFNMKKILLIVPCFNEESRINFNDFVSGMKNCREGNIELQYLFTNDGSTDNTRKMLDDFCQKNPGFYCYHLKENAGKGNAIQEAYQNKKTELKFQTFDWIGFWDADLATPLAEIPRMMAYLDFYKDRSISSVWGSRISRLGSRIKRQPHRHYLGRIFVTLVSLVLKVKAYDSQCGAKLFTPSAGEIAFQEPFLSRWIFDVEILLRLKEESIIEYPLFNWEDIPGSKVKVFKEIGRVGRDILQIRKKYLS